MASTSGPYILSVVQQTVNNTGAPAPDAAVSGSPLWPLQQALRAGFTAATNTAGITPEQVARTWPLRTQIEDMFGEWQTDPVALLRSAINLTIADADFANDPTLAMFQSELLALPQWSDTLPS